MNINSPHSQESLTLHYSQEESEEYLVDIETMTPPDDKNYDDDPVFDFEQNLYEQALVSAELKDDPWKEFNTEDIQIWQEVSFEETSGKYTEEIPTIITKPTTPCVIIDNEHGEIRRSDTETALLHFSRLIETVAYSENDRLKEHLLQALFPCLENFNLDLPSSQPSKLPSLFVVNTAFKNKQFDFSKQQFTQKPKKYEEFGKSLALEVLRSRSSLDPYKLILEIGLDVDLCGKNLFIKEWMKKLSQIFKQLIAEHPIDFAMNEINVVLKREINRKEALWKLVETLYKAITSNQPKKHSLFKTANQLILSEYERIFTCYNKGVIRITKIVRQDIL
ncbi:5333_t:CDS:2 [Scutellospora calospora]|uniref:5333_t:CDS:1 n=1 Tax=Scutellospora calospora TaxID=85575 RepID=A0ACA9KZ40_9GLOM|nr:5333_t:CDS:2 [Scutellospora calospora]